MAPRRARGSARQAGLQKTIDKGIAAEVEKIARRKLARGIQGFAIRSMNSLAQQGPAWSGEFSASWGFAPQGQTPNTPGTTGRIYRYTKNDVTIYEVERYLRAGYEKFSISNTSEHAAIAIDEEEAKFAPPSYQPYPIGDVVKFGSSRPSNEHLRWQIRDDSMEEDVTSQITAEPFWYQNYLRGGGLQQDLSAGFSFGFEAVQ
jgi:hypothetical protein